MTNEQIDELLAEIGRTPLLTADEELALLKTVKQKGCGCNEMKQLEKANMRFVVSLVSQYQHQGSDHSESYQKMSQSGRV